MAASSEIAAYRATHSVAQTAAYFNVSERRVYQACKSATPATSNDTSCRPHSPVSAIGSGKRSIIPKLDDVADGVTEWRDPVTKGAAIPRSGVTAREWFAGKDLHEVKPATALSVSCETLAASRPSPAPVYAPEPMQTRTTTSFAHEYAVQALPLTSSQLDHSKRISSRLLPASSVNPFTPSLVERVHPLVWIILTLLLCLYVFGFPA